MMWSRLLIHQFYCWRIRKLKRFTSTALCVENLYLHLALSISVVKNSFIPMPTSKFKVVQSGRLNCLHLNGLKRLHATLSKRAESIAVRCMNSVSNLAGTYMINITALLRLT